MRKAKRKVKRPAEAHFRSVWRHGFLVAELIRPGPKITAAEVRRLTRALRERRMK